MPTLFIRFARVLFVFSFLSFLGCGSERRGGTINGTVTLDGKPLEEGLVTFVPMDGKGQPTDGKIVNGKFSVAVSPGEMKVMFSAPKVVGKKKMYDTPDSPSVDDVRELLPEKYNAQSKLKITVASGIKEESFALTSK